MVVRASLAIAMAVGAMGCGSEVVADETTSGRTSATITLDSYLEGDIRTCQFTTEPVVVHQIDFAIVPGADLPLESTVRARVFVDASPTDDPADACEESELRWSQPIGEGASYVPAEALLLDTSRLEYEAIFDCAGCDPSLAPRVLVTLDYEPLVPSP